MNNNRPSLDQIFGGAQSNTQDPASATGSRPSLSDIFSGNQAPAQPAQPVQNNRETIFRSSNGNYLDNITPDGPIQSTVNFVGDLAGSAYTPFQKLGNTLLSGVNAGMEKLTGMPTPENMKFDLGTDASMNPITGESSLPVYKDEKGNVMGAGGTALNTLGTMAEAGLNVVVPGEGTALKTALLADGLLPTLLKGFKSGTKLGLGFGAATGAQGITDASDGSQWGQAAITTGLGGLIGGPLGLIGGLLSNAANSRLRKTFMEDIQKGLSMEESPAIKEVADVLGMNTPEAVARTRQDSIDQIYKEITQSTRNPIQNIDAQMTTDPAYKDDVLGTLIDNISVGDTFGKNRVNWSGTTKALTEKEELLNQALKDVQDADSNGMRVSTGLTPDSLLNYIQTAASSVTRDKDVVNDVVAKASSKIAQYTKNGSITLDGLNALRDIGNDLYRAGDPTGSAMSLAIKRYTQDVLANPQSLGLSEKVVNAINDNDLIWNELRKIKLTKTFLKKWAPETLLKDTGFARQLAGAVGFGVSNGNFFGYLGAQALTDKILNSAAKSKMMKLYGNAFTKMGADKASGDLRKGLMDNIAAIGKEEMEKRQAAQKKSIIKDLAKLKEKAVTDAKYSPPNQELYTPYTPESKLPTINMGSTPNRKVNGITQDTPLNFGSNVEDIAKQIETEQALKKKKNDFLNEPYTPDDQLPTIDMGATPKKNKSTEPYIDFSTGELVDPKTGKKSKIDKKVLTAMGITGAGAASASAGYHQNTDQDEIAAVDTATNNIASVSDKYAPNLDPNYIKVLLQQESSGGTNDDSRDYDAGKYGWLVGFTKGTWKNILDKANAGDKRYVNLLNTIGGKDAMDTPEGAMRAALAYSQFIMRDFKAENSPSNKENKKIYKKMTAAEVYKAYNGGGNKDAQKNFEARWAAMGFK